MPEVVANVAWGDDGQTLYMTASTGVYRIRLDTGGTIPGSNPTRWSCRPATATSPWSCSRTVRPVSVRNFLQYVYADFYTDTVFHRVIDDFMIQGGGFGADLSRRFTREPIRNEADNGISNTRGTVAMARTAAVNSATSQFFINLSDNARRGLDYRGDTAEEFGYAVFGRVSSRGAWTSSTQIAGVDTRPQGSHQDAPVTPVVINDITVQ